MTEPSDPKPVFVCYAHEDNGDPDRKKRWLDRICTHLKPLEFTGQLTVCSDREIAFGDDWHERIQAQLNAARVAVLLISSNFMASAYIRNHEMPALLHRASRQGMKILPVLVGPSVFAEHKFKYPDPKTGPEEFTLASLQAAAWPNKTLMEMNDGEQERILVAVARRIMDLVKGPSEEPAQRPLLKAVPGPDQVALTIAQPTLQSRPQRRERRPDSQFLDRLRAEIKAYLDSAP